VAASRLQGEVIAEGLRFLPTGESAAATSLLGLPTSVPASTMDSDKVVVNGLRLEPEYGRAFGLVDRPAIWSGRLKAKVEGEVSDWIENTRGAEAAVTAVQWGLAIAGGPVKLAAGFAYGAAQERLVDASTGAYKEAGYGQFTSREGGEGLPWLAAVALGTVVLAKGFRGAPKSHILNALKDFKTKTFRAGGNTFRLDKAGMKHILERHHPKYWDGSVKDKQTFFDESDSIDFISDAIMDGLSQNRGDLATKSFFSRFSSKQFKFQFGQREFVLGIKAGRVGQFYPTGN